MSDVYQTVPYTDAYRKYGKLTDLTIEEMNRGTEVKVLDAEGTEICQVARIYFIYNFRRVFDKIVNIIKSKPKPVLIAAKPIKRGRPKRRA